MPLSEMPVEQLREFRPEVLEPDDFDAFWTRTLADSRAQTAPPELRTAETPLTELVVEDLTFSGFGGERIRGWVIRPLAGAPRPAVVEFLGYGGGRGIPGEHLRWASAGYVHVVMDTRGQGGSWGSGGATPDPHGSGSTTPGYMTRGIESADTYYYRRVFTDAALLIDAVQQFDFVDPDRISVTGGNQGGGISIAVAALHPAVRAAMPDVPFLCHFRHSVERTPEHPFREIEQYLSAHRDQVRTAFDTLAYFDGVNFARRITAPTLFSVALMDTIVLPSSVFAAFNHCASTDAQIEVYPFNGHEGGQTAQWVRQTAWLAERL